MFKNEPMSIDTASFIQPSEYSVINVFVKPEANDTQPVLNATTKFTN